ncbi:MAG: hypothetical protein BWK80_15475 [Desulfobacteraceae bacterium IS3]|nr:MAG: hypothetical protein BWK80_15475 [Desulfobacteraceae bacterium IS3]
MNLESFTVKEYSKKMKLNLTIRRMLTGLVFTGVIVICTLSGINIASNSGLMNTQKQLTELVLPMDAATQSLKAAAADFSLRSYAVRHADSTEALEKISARKQLEQAFSSGIRGLKELAGEAKKIQPARKLPESVAELEKLYAEMLEKDNAVLVSVQEGLKLEKNSREQAAMLDTTEEELYRNSEILSEKIVSLFRSQNEKTYVTGTAEICNIRTRLFSLGSLGRQMMLAADPDKIAEIGNIKIPACIGHIADALKTLSAAVNGVSQQSEQKDLQTLLDAVEKNFSLMKSLLVKGDSSIAQLRTLRIAQQKSIHALGQELQTRADLLTAGLKTVQSASDKVRSLAQEEAEAVSLRLGNIVRAVGLFSVVFMLGAGWLIARRILIPINKAVSFADVISKGDLTAEIQKEHDDEVGNLVSKLGEMAHNLNSLIGQVQRSGIQVTSSATELSATSRQQEAVMRTQLESTNYVLKSVGEISNVSEELVKTVREVAAMSDQTAEFAAKGQSDLGQMEDAMRHMENASKSISGKLEAINEKAANITSVVTTITKVADQTNLLSLNAAIEAEKAGEYGRGFTVVAREIRRLADQTAVATLDIDQMVQEMQSAVSAGVMEMDAFIKEVQRSAENVGKISMQLSRIIEQVQALSPSFEGVNESMQFQSQNAQQINNSMVNLSEEMQQTVDSLRESFMAIEQLNDAARGLQDEVSRFKVM